MMRQNLGFETSSIDVAGDMNYLPGPGVSGKTFVFAPIKHFNHLTFQGWI